MIYSHLAGEHTVGVYPLLEDGTCYFLAVDFDEADWRGDARAFMQSCNELGVPASLEVSRSGQGAHVKLAGPMPTSLTVTLANLIYFEKAQLPQALANV